LREPKERKLGQKLVWKYQAGSSKLVTHGEFCYDVELLDLIAALLKIDLVINQD
jgi:hypothetical protein